MEAANKKVFLDLGTHYGQGLREFIRKYNMDSSWEIHTFEANPKTHKIFIKDYLKETPWVISHNKAVSNVNGKITVHGEQYMNEHGTGQGSSIIPRNDWNTNQKFTDRFEVDCIDLSEFIRYNFNKTDFIVVKMDIEGSEYDTLEKMIQDETIQYINDIYVEWHLRCFIKNKEMIQKREESLKSYLKNNLDHFENWI